MGLLKIVENDRNIFEHKSKSIKTQTRNRFHKQGENTWILIFWISKFCLFPFKPIYS